MNSTEDALRAFSPDAEVRRFDVVLHGEASSEQATLWLEAQYPDDCDPNRVPVKAWLRRQNGDESKGEGFIDLSDGPDAFESPDAFEGPDAFDGKVSFAELGQCSVEWRVNTLGDAGAVQTTALVLRCR